jgi:putative hydrolase of the HAD superfamily
MLADLRSEPLVFNAVQRLRSNGVRVCVLSNSWGTSPFDPYAPFKLDENYDAVVISHEVGLRKPDPEIFKIAVDRLGSEFDQCVFIDDVARYLDVARTLGMGTIHATDPKTTVAAISEAFSNHMQ